MVALVKQKFVAVAIDGRIANTRIREGKTINLFTDAEVDFLREHKVRLAASAQGTVDTLTASGKHLAYPELHSANGAFKASLERALKVWAKLPEAERLPGAVKVPTRGPLDPKRAVAAGPPEGALILRVHNRQLGRDDNGVYRYTVPEDYLPALRDPSFGIVGNDGAPAHYRQPSNDMMWIVRDEWQAMMPAKPVHGQKVPVPATLQERILKFHLDPARGLGEDDTFAGPSARRDGQLQLTVEEISEREVRLRLEGTATLHNPWDSLKSYESNSVKKFSQFKVGSSFGHGITYQPRLLGSLAYDPVKRMFTRFDVVALGNLRGRPTGGNVVAERLGAENPLGIAFELVTDPTPADQLRPKALGNGEWFDLPRYLGAAK